MNGQADRALGEALRLAEHGYRLTPVTITRDPQSGKKRGRFHRGWRHEDAWSADPEQIRAWWVDHPDTSFALGGAANGIEGVDLDVKPDRNAVEWWNAQGLPLSSLLQWTPSGGAHLIWRVRPDRELPQEAGKTFGRGVDTRNRGGLFFAAGSYVVGEGGHYEIAGELPKLADLPYTPPVVLDLFAEHGRAARPDRPADGRIVTHDLDWQRKVTGAALDAIRVFDRNAGGYRKLLQTAGLMFGRVVEQDALYPTISRERAEAVIVDAHRSVWGDVVWPVNLKDIRDALDDGPRLERWRVPAEAVDTSGVRLQTVQLNTPLPGPTPRLQTVTPPVGGHDRDLGLHDHVHPNVPHIGQNTDGATSDSGDTAWPGEQGYDPDAVAERKRLELDAKAIEDETRKRMARRVVSAAEREPLRILSGLAFLRAPMPEYLVPDMLFVDSTAKVFGPPGSTKSFFVLDLAMCLALGRNWRGKRLGRHKVHYVMAEGQAVNTVRALGWLHHFAPATEHEELDGWLTVIPQGVLLTPEGVADYLTHVERDQPALIVLDTKNRMMVGNENDAGDNAVLVRAMDALRTAAGRSCVLLVDHTGVHDTSRGRGSNAVEGAMDTEIRVTMEHGLATAEVTRNKASTVNASWSYRLHTVKDVPGLRPGTPDPAVCVPAMAGDTEDPFELAVSSWWQHAIDDPVPDPVALLKGPGSNEARDIFRILRYARDEMSMAALLRAINEKPRERKCSEATARRGRILLEQASVVLPLPGPKYGLSSEFLTGSVSLADLSSGVVIGPGKS